MLKLVILKAHRVLLSNRALQEEVSRHPERVKPTIMLSTLLIHLFVYLYKSLTLRNLIYLLSAKVETFSRHAFCKIGGLLILTWHSIKSFATFLM